MDFFIKKIRIMTVVTLFFLIRVQPCNCQVTFQKTFGGAEDDRGISVIRTEDGGYAVLGCTKSFGEGKEDVYLVRTDLKGDVLWTNTYGGTGQDFGWDILETSGNGFIIAGYTDSFGGGLFDCYVIKINKDGNLIWERTYGGTGDEYCWNITQTENNGYILCAQTGKSRKDGNVDAMVIKIDSDGNEVWKKTYGGEKVDRIYSVCQTPDGGYIAAGTTDSFGNSGVDAYVIKTDSSGNLMWSKTFGGSGYDVGHSVDVTIDGGFIITGYGESFAKNGMDVYLIKLNSSGSQIWLKSIDININDRALTGIETSDGEYVLTGYTQKTKDSLHDVLLIKTDSKGETSWIKTFGRETYAMGYTVEETADGGFILTGEIWNTEGGKKDIYLIKMDGNGFVEN